MLHCLTLLHYKVHFQRRDTKWTIPRCHNSLSSHEICNRILNKCMMVTVFQAKVLKKILLVAIHTQAEDIPWDLLGSVFKEAKHSNTILSPKSTWVWYHHWHLITWKEIVSVRCDLIHTALRLVLSDLHRSCQLRHANHQQCYIAWHCSLQGAFPVKRYEMNYTKVPQFAVFPWNM